MKFKVTDTFVGDEYSYGSVDEFESLGYALDNSVKGEFDEMVALYRKLEELKAKFESYNIVIEEV